MLELASRLSVNSLRNVAFKTIFNVQRNYRRYCGRVDDNSVYSSVICIELIDDLDDIFAQVRL